MEPAEMPPNLASAPTLGLRSAAADMSGSAVGAVFSCALLPLGGRASVDGVVVLGARRCGFSWPGVADAPGSGGGICCATVLPRQTSAIATRVDCSFIFMMHILELGRWYAACSASQHSQMVCPIPGAQPLLWRNRSAGAHLRPDSVLTAQISAAAQYETALGMELIVKITASYLVRGFVHELRWLLWIILNR